MVPGSIRFIGATSTNNGITALIGNDQHVHSANTITVSYNGSVGEAFYQSERFWASDDINVFYPKFGLTEARALYVIPLIKQQGERYAYSNKWTKEKMEGERITLPVISEGSRQLDLAYMDAYISEMGAARIRELDKWLRDSGLDDCRLCAQEQKALDDWREGRIKQKISKVGSLFSIETPKRRFNANAIKFGGTHPYVVRTSQNNGRRGTIVADDRWLNPGNTISFGQDTATIFYQDTPYFTGDKIKVMQFRHGTLDARIACCLLTVMRKAFSNFTWGTSSFNEDVLRNVEVAVPITPADELDFDFMSHFIRAIIKQSIRGVVDWKNHEIAAMPLDDAGLRTPGILSDVGEALKYREYFPLYSLKAACGKFGDGEEVECSGWVRVPGYRGHGESLFVVQAVGHSMEDKIKDGQYCVFEHRRGQFSDDDIVLAQEHTIADSETSGAFTIKKIRKEGDGIVLYPVNRSFEKMVFDESHAPKIIGTYRGDLVVG